MYKRQDIVVIDPHEKHKQTQETSDPEEPPQEMSPDPLGATLSVLPTAVADQSLNSDANALYQQAAVSYTHLDVYKRQDISSIVGHAAGEMAARLGIGGGAAGRPRNEGCDDGGIGRRNGVHGNLDRAGTNRQPARPATPCPWPTMSRCGVKSGRRTLY